jgi:hypothetical protein
MALPNKTRECGMRKKGKIRLMVMAALLVMGMAAYAQEAGSVSVGVLAEGNLGTRKGLNVGGGLIADYGISDRFSFGIKLDYGNDLSEVQLFEGMVFGRYYVPLNMSLCHIFAQAGVGAITFLEKGSDIIPSVVIDLSFGARFPLQHFYGEPYIRVGYPVPFGFGLVLGYRF